MYQDMCDWLELTNWILREEKKETSFNSSPKVTWKLWSAPPGSPEFPPASQSKETMCSHCPDRVAWSQDTDRRLRVRVALRTACCLPFSEICCQLQKLKFERSALESTPIIYPGPRRHAAVWSKSSRLALDHPACQKRSKKKAKRQNGLDMLHHVASYLEWIWQRNWKHFRAFSIVQTIHHPGSTSRQNSTPLKCAKSPPITPRIQFFTANWKSLKKSKTSRNWAWTIRVFNVMAKSIRPFLSQHGFS